MTSENNQTAFDADKAESFSEKLLTALNYGSLSLMMSIGHRTGIFDAMRVLPPTTSEEVAKASGLNERYFREWLGAMVTAGVVDVDPTSTRYTLPAEHAAFLTRAAGADNLAVFTQSPPPRSRRHRLRHFAAKECAPRRRVVNMS